MASTDENTSMVSPDEVTNVASDFLEEEKGDKAKRKIFLGNLSFKIDEKTLFNAFKSYGRIISIQWITDLETGKFYGSAFAIFNSNRAATAALRLNGKAVMGRPIKVGLAKVKADSRGPDERNVVELDVQGNLISEEQSIVNQNKRIFLGNLAFKINDEIIKDTFSEVGTITDIFWIKCKTTNKFYGSVIVTFSTHQECIKALKMDQTVVLGRKMKVGWATSAQPLSKKIESTDTIFLGNLPYSIDEEAVKLLFEKYGTIKDIRWIMKDEAFQGCAHLQFDDEESVEEAVKSNGFIHDGRVIRVDYSSKTHT